MNKGRVLLSIGLIVLALWSWLSYAKKVNGREDEFNAYIESAESLSEKQLYQMSIKEYEKAFRVREDEEKREDWLETYKKAEEDGVVDEGAYLKALGTFCSIFPNRIDKWETLIGGELEEGDYQGARAAYLKSAKAGVTSEKLEEYKDVIYYSYREWGEAAINMIPSTSGWLQVIGEMGYGLIDNLGDRRIDARLEYVAPIGKETIYLTKAGENESRVFDKDAVVQAVIKPAFTEAKAIGEHVIPYCEDEKWYYFDYADQKKILGPFADVTTFCNGVAAVKKDNHWILIDKNGESVGDQKFTEIATLGNGEYVNQGIMIASAGKGFGIYDAKGNAKNDFSAAKMDFYMGDWIAFQDNSGKWGFVDQNGEVQIKPEYTGALSFSNGLAAVEKDGAWGFINHSNVMVIKNQFGGALYFNSDGVTAVCDIETTRWHMLALKFKYGK